MFTNPDFISPQEAGKYSRYMKVFKKDDLIYKEGEPLDDGFHLIRTGSVGVFRTIGGEDVLIDRIGAISFVGEIEIFIPGPRIGTVKVLSDLATTYQFKKSELNIIHSEPVFSEMMIRRLTGDLKDFVNRYVKQEDAINRLLDEKEITVRNFVMLLSIINQSLSHIPDENSLVEKNAAYLKSLNEMINSYLVIKLPEIKFYMDQKEAQDFRSLYEENLIPEDIARELVEYIRLGR